MRIPSTLVVISVFAASLLYFPKNIYASINFYRSWLGVTENAIIRQKAEAAQMIPSVTPSYIPTLTPTFVPTQTPTSTPVPTSMPTNIPTPTISNDKKGFILQAINEFRKSKGVSEASSDTQTCNFANTRASEIAINFNHDGFNNRMSSNSLPYPAFSSVTEKDRKSTDYKKNLVLGF